jgi:hypothetical protein
MLEYVRNRAHSRASMPLHRPPTIFQAKAAVPLSAGSQYPFGDPIPVDR